jgi:hypothetical protein
VRLVWSLIALLPPLRCNHPLFDRRGITSGRRTSVDLEAGVAIEYEGLTHLRLGQRGKDIGKEETYRRVGLEYLSVVATHLHDHQLLAARMHAVRERAAFAAESRRDWTVTPPPWWLPTTTVELRRRLDERDRQRLLRYRVG